MTAHTRTAVAAPEPPRRPLTVADLTITDPVWVHAAGLWWRGEVVQLGLVRVRVRYLADQRGASRERWFSCSDGDPVYHGGLSEPVRYRCATPRCRLVCPGRPGQSLDLVRVLHEQSPLHNRMTPPPAAQPWRRTP